MPTYALGDHEPQLHPDAYVHPDAVVIGRVSIGAESTPIDPAKQQEWIDCAVREYVDSGRVCAKDLRLVSARTHA